MALKNKKSSAFYFFWRKKKLQVNGNGILDVQKHGLTKKDEDEILSQMGNLFERTSSPTAPLAAAIGRSPVTMVDGAKMKAEKVDKKTSSSAPGIPNIEARVAELQKEEPVDPDIAAEASKEIDLSEFGALGAAEKAPKTVDPLEELGLLPKSDPEDVLKELLGDSPAIEKPKRGRGKKKA